MDPVRRARSFAPPSRPAAAGAGARERRAVGIAALALLACGPAAGPYTVRAAPPPPAPARAAAPPPALRVLLLGDFGDDTAQQRAVAAAAARASRTRPLDLVLGLGDNVYECGPDPSVPGAAACRFSADANTVDPAFGGAPDPLFERLFEAPLAGVLRDGSPVPTYTVLGNHDVHSGIQCRKGLGSGVDLARLRACLSVAHRSPRWTMPGRHYVLDRGPARFVVLDSNLLGGDYGGFSFDEEVALLREAARTAGDRPLFVVAHHPPATAGEHRGELAGERLARIRRLEEAAEGRIAAWLAGHDHDLQHLRAAGGYDVFVSGNGSRGRPRERFEVARPKEARLLFATTAWGFGTLEVSPGGWGIQFESDRGAPLHCCAATPPGPCQPVACPASP